MSVRVSYVFYIVLCRLRPCDRADSPSEESHQLPIRFTVMGPGQRAQCEGKNKNKRKEKP
jgi:hypothetical protein